MKVLVITGDNSFRPGHTRFNIQASQVGLTAMYWRRGSLWPKIPPGHFDVVTVQDPFWRGLFGSYVAWRTGAKFNVQVHTDLSAQNLFRHLLAQVVLRHADSVRVVSEKIREQVLSAGVRAPVFVLPIYVDIEKFKSVKPQSHSQKTILWVGRFEPEKDPLLALEVLHNVRRKISDCKLVMLGTGSMAQQLKTALARFHLASAVEMPGWQDPTSYYAIADVVLCTSKHESYGASIIEALVAGIPVVAPDVGIAREAGAIIAPRERLAEAVAEVLRSGKRGELKLTLPSAEEWAHRWRQTLEHGTVNTP